MPNLSCSFCGKNEDMVATLIAGPKVNICNECVDLCVEILDNKNVLFEAVVSTYTDQAQSTKVAAEIAKLEGMEQSPERSVRLIKAYMRLGNFEKADELLDKLKLK